MTDEPVDLAQYKLSKTQSVGTHAEWHFEESSRWTVRSWDDAARSRVSGGGAPINISRLYGSEHDSLMGRFFHVSQRLLQLLDEARELLAESDHIGADDRLTLAKAAAAELFMVRPAGDAISVVALRVIQVLAGVPTILDGSEQLELVQTAVRRLRMAPLMMFEEAAELVEPLEDYAVDITGYGMVAQVLFAVDEGETAE